jgi:hypothetical protein
MGGFWQLLKRRARHTRYGVAGAVISAPAHTGAYITGQTIVLDGVTMIT